MTGPWTIYVDGSCLGNQNVDADTPAAWAVVVVSGDSGLGRGNGSLVEEFAGFDGLHGDVVFVLHLGLVEMLVFFFLTRLAPLLGLLSMSPGSLSRRWMEVLLVLGAWLPWRLLWFDALF